MAKANIAVAGTWTPLSQLAPDQIQTMLLLSDGTVMAAGNSDITNTWYRLTPDSLGGYVNGTWSTIARMHDTRLYYSSDVLTNGSVFVAGAEYGTGTNSAEVYDPVRDTWTRCQPPPVGQTLFYDSVSKILPNGNVLIAPVGPAIPGGTVIYLTASNSWANGGTLFRGSYQDEASWVKLPDDSVLTIDPFGVNSERYIPSLNTWVNDGNVPVSLYDSFGFELGAAFLLPNGKAFFLGATGNTALYTPSGSTSPGTWGAGPVIPNAQATPDAPAAMMVNGKILCAVSPLPTSGNHFPSPTSFYEYDSSANSFTRVNGPTGLTFPASPYLMRMLDLPDGNVLLTTSDNQLYVYQPAGFPLAAGKPAISNITQNVDGSFHVSGTLFNGISEGAAYGDDAQMDSNYPLVRMTNSNSGVVYYARTFGWNSTSVMTGNRLVSTEFTVPVGLPSADYQLVVTANGNSSDPVLFSTTALPPLIVSQPQNQTVTVSNSATFTLGAAGMPLTYAWRQNGTLIPGATGSSYTFTNAQISDSGKFYSCIVSNANGSAASSNAFLSVIPGVPPMITVQPVDITVAAGGPASFSITVTSSVPVSYYWERNGSIISGATMSSYTTNNVQLADSGALFSCVVTSIYGSDLSSNATLTVVVGPSNDLCSAAFVINGIDYTNAQSTLLATSAGDPSPSCITGFGKGVWYVFSAVADGTVIADTIGSRFDTGLGVYSGDCGALTQLACNDDGGGNLTSRTTNSVFAGTTYYYLCGGYAGASGNLVFHFHFTGEPLSPNIVVQPANQTVPPNGSATFTISATGAAPLSYLWSRDGSPIVGATASSYTTNKIQFADSGSQFRCFVSNAYGNVFSSAAALSVIDSALPNGGFETGDFTFWSTSGNFQDSFVTGSSPYVHSGGFGAQLGPIGSLGYLSQSVGTVPGQLYVISFWLYCDGGIPNEFSVAWDGTTLFDQVDIPSVGWNNLQLLAAAPASSPQLQFGFQNDGSWFGLDDIVVVPFAPPAIQSISQTNNVLSFTWSSVAGLTYEVQYTTDLGQPNWTSLGVFITASGNTTSASDFVIDPQRFYRVVLSLQGPAHK